MSAGGTPVVDVLRLYFLPGMIEMLRVFIHQELRRSHIGDHDARTVRVHESKGRRSGLTEIDGAKPRLGCSHDRGDLAECVARSVSQMLDHHSNQSRRFGLELAGLTSLATCSGRKLLVQPGRSGLVDHAELARAIDQCLHRDLPTGLQESEIAELKPPKL